MGEKIKNILVLMMFCCLCIGLSACGSSAGQAENASTEPAQAEAAETVETSDSAEDDSVQEETEKQEETAAVVETLSLEQKIPSSGSDVLVVVFSATGTTKGVAEKIATIENADLYEIVPVQPYSEGDLNWHDSNSRTTKEQDDASVRPEIAGDTVDLSGYAKIYVGYPIWWGEEPRIMDTFVESYDFGSATIIPFCTSGGSGIGRSGKNLADNAGSGNWLDGARFSGSVSEDELQSWINGMN